MKKSFIMALALVLVLGIAIGGTVAWLTATTDTVTNTFTVGDIKLEISETGANNNAKSYTTVPGSTYAKDPKVTVKAGSEACWLFVHIEETNNTMKVNDVDVKIVNWTIANGWTPVTDHSGYYYKEIDTATTTDTDYYVFAGDTTNTTLANGYVTINENVAKDQIKDTNKPVIEITAAAVQRDNVTTVTDAWSKLPASFTGATA